MEERCLHRLFYCFYRVWGFSWRRHKMHEWLGNTEEHQADAHARRKKHRQPGEYGKFGFGVIGPKAYIAVF